MQRFGGSLNFNPHVHMIGIDGVYSLDEHTALPRFHFQPAPTPAEIQGVTQTVRDRVLKMLRRQNLIKDDTHESNEEKEVNCALEGCRNAALSRGDLNASTNRVTHNKTYFLTTFLLPVGKRVRGLRILTVFLSRRAFILARWIAKAGND